MSTKMSPFDLASNINEKGGFLDIDEVGYEPYVVNRIFSNTVDTVLFANEMNIAWSLPKEMQYAFFYFGLPKKKRFGKWYKKNQEDDASLAVIQEYYGYSRAKAKSVLKLLMPVIPKMREELEKGGRHGAKK